MWTSTSYTTSPPSQFSTNMNKHTTPSQQYPPHITHLQNPFKTPQFQISSTKNRSDHKTYSTRTPAHFRKNNNTKKTKNAFENLKAKKEHKPLLKGLLEFVPLSESSTARFISLHIKKVKHQVKYQLSTLTHSSLLQSPLQISKRRRSQNLGHKNAPTQHFLNKHTHKIKTQKSKSSPIKTCRKPSIVRPSVETEQEKRA